MLAICRLTLLACTMVITGHNLVGATSIGREWFYSIIIDAGSKGTRLIVYKWQPELRLPRVSIQFPEQIGFKSVNPGLSAYAFAPQNVSTSLRELIGYATGLLDPLSDLFHLIPIYLKGTAGLRDLTPVARDAVMGATRSFLSNTSDCPFYFEPDQALVISGEEEGAFAWLSVNALKSTIGGVSGDSSYGVIDLGGASTQIAFVPERNHYILQNCFPLALTDTCSYRTYSKSYLHYGLVEANRRLSSNIIAENLLKIESIDMIENPCYYKGHRFTPDDFESTHVPLTVEMMGTGNFTKCMHEISNLFNKGVGIQCWVRDCTFDGVYQPRLDARPFIGIGNIGKVLSRANIGKNSSLETIKLASIDICETMNFDDVRVKYDQVSEKFALHFCFSLSYIYTLLTYGLGFQDLMGADGKKYSQIEFASDIDGTKADWAYGAIIYEANQQPPKTIHEYLELAKKHHLQQNFEEHELGHSII